MGLEIARPISPYLLPPPPPPSLPALGSLNLRGLADRRPISVRAHVATCGDGKIGRQGMRGFAAL